MKIEESQGYKTLKKDIDYDCFNRSNKVEDRCKDRTCRHAEKLNWILDRVKHYAEKTGLSGIDILNRWEKERNYWYMNYYQDTCQPLLDDKIRVFETSSELRESIKVFIFICPACNFESTDYQECTSPDCDWKSYGLLKCLGKGVTVFIKETCLLHTFFMPKDWIKNNKQREKK